MTRRTISNTARARIFENAGGVCSICRQRIQAGQRWQVSHEVPLALGGADEPGNMRPAHYTCHRVQTAETDIPQIAKMKRQRLAHIGAKRSARPMPCGRNSPWKKTMSGEVVRR